MNNSRIYNSYLWSENIFVEFVVSHIVVMDVLKDTVHLLRAEKVDAKGRSL